MRKERRSAEEIVAAMEEARQRMDMEALERLRRERILGVIRERQRDAEVRGRSVLEGEAVASSMGTPPAGPESMGGGHGEVAVTLYDPPKHLCPRHGEHPRWISLYGYGDPMPAYCMDCIVNLLDREKVGRVLLKG